MLEVRNLTKKFGGLIALKQININIRQGEIVGLIGPNGAGKSTLINVISGVYKPDDGEVIWKGINITRMPPHKIAELGIRRTFQTSRIFYNLTVAQNIKIAQHFYHLKNKEIRDINNEMEKILCLLKLSIEDNQGKSITLFEQKKLEIAMKLIGGAELIMLDEPAGGLSQSEIDEMIKIIMDLNNHGLTILIIEHTMRVIMGLCDRVIVLCEGEKIAEGTPVQIRGDTKVIEAYLGSE